jgi:hypothetical protein
VILKPVVGSVRLEYVIVHQLQGLVNLVFALREDVSEDFLTYFDRWILHLIDRFDLRFEVGYQFVSDDYFLDEIFSVHYLN